VSWTARREDWTAQPEDARQCGDIDYARVIHSGSFRRLQGKTQILNLGDSDFYRTRLTHSLEVAQIAGSIARQLAKSFNDHPGAMHLPGLSMIQAIGCTHDLGHPPFGHGGEVALNYCMRDVGGFEGNGQTLRIVSKLEKFSANSGSNLSRRTMLGLLKYPVPFSLAANATIKPSLDDTTSTVKIINRQTSKPPKCYLDSEQDVVDWILQPLNSKDRDIFSTALPTPGKHNVPVHKSFDCSIMDLADDISFGVHDLEDALALRLLTEVEFRKHAPEGDCVSFLDQLKYKYPGESRNNVYETLVGSLFGNGNVRKRFISRMIHHFVTHCEIETISDLQEPLIRYRARMTARARTFLSALIKLVKETVILSPSVQHLEFKGQTMVVAVFETLRSDPKAFLPPDVYERLLASPDKSRIICDHIAGMTDTFLLKTFDRLFSPRMGSVFDKL